MVVPLNKGTPMWTQPYDNSSYGDPQKGIPNFGKPHIHFCGNPYGGCQSLSSCYRKTPLNTASEELSERSRVMQRLPKTCGFPRLSRKDPSVPYHDTYTSSKPALVSLVPKFNYPTVGCLDPSAIRNSGLTTCLPSGLIDPPHTD